MHKPSYQKKQNNLLVKLLYLGLRLYRQLVGSENPTRIPPTTQYKPTHPPQPFRDSADDKAEGDDRERVEITTRVTDVKNLARRLRVTVGESPL